MPITVRTFGLLCFAATLMPACGSALAAERVVSIVNQSGDVIQAVALKTVGESGPVPTGSLANPISSGDTGDLTLNLEDGTCVAEVTFHLGNGNVIVQNDIDLCSVDGIVVE
jgi:hypothetical protein